MMNMRQLLFALTMMTTVTVSARNYHETAALSVPLDSADTKVFDVVEQMPSFAGGEYVVRYRDEEGNVHEQTKTCPPGQAGLFQYLSNTIQYPVVAEENGVQGRVIVTFVVERDGSITDVKVVKSVDPSLDREAVRVVRSMPKWTPGKQKGDAVRVKYTMPVTFRLQ
jgi:protein TonB